MGSRVAVVRHPMPYGDLAGASGCSASPAYADLRTAAAARSRRREEVRAAHLARGHGGLRRAWTTAPVLGEAEREADIVLVWDGGNNDTPFIVPDLEIVLLHPHRAGHERTYFPGQVNLLRADVLVLTKMDTASQEQIHVVRANIRQFNPKAVVLETTMPVTVDLPHLIKGKRVLVVEDGPTLTHGGMSFGAGVLAAKQQGARELVDPRAYAVGTIQQTFIQYPHIGPVLPAIGYGGTQIRELEDTIKRIPCDVI